jgi:uncharacterized protein YjdB
MALTEYTVTIINKNTDPTVVGEGYKPLVVISPSGITTPQTPYDEWVADSATLLSGAVSIPAWKKLQYFILPASSKLVIMTDIADEAVYYQEMIGKYKNVEITVSTAPITTYSLTLTADKTSIAPAGTATLTATGVGFTASDVTYTSSDETVATVADGTVTGVADGTVTITATTTTGASDGNIPVSATIKITVATA